MSSESTKKTLFSVTCDYTKGAYQSVNAELTERLLHQTRAAKLSHWIYDLGTQRYRGLVNAYESQKQDRGRKIWAHEEVAKLNEVFQQEHYKQLHIFFHDRKHEDPMQHSVSKFCESSALIAYEGSLEDRRALLKRWEACLASAGALWSVYEKIDQKVEGDHREVAELYRKFLAVEGSVLRFPSNPYSEQDIKDIVHAAYNLDAIRMRARQLANGMGREVAQTIITADARIKQQWQEMEKHKERLGGIRQYGAGKGTIDDSSANASRTHIKYNVKIEIDRYKFSNEVCIRDGLFCRAKTERAKPKQGEDEAKWRPPKYEALLEITVNPPMLTLNQLKASPEGSFSETMQIKLPQKARGMLSVKSETSTQSGTFGQGPSTVRITCTKIESASCDANQCNKGRRNAKTWINSGH